MPHGKGEDKGGCALRGREMTGEAAPGEGGGGRPASGIIRALLPALLMSILLAAMIAGGISRNRARAQGAVEQHSGRSKLATYADHAARWLDARQEPEGAWNCDGEPSSELTARVLLNLARAGRSDDPSFAPALAWLRREAGASEDSSAPESALIVDRALGSGAGPVGVSDGQVPAPAEGIRAPEDGEVPGAGGDGWIRDAYLSLLTERVAHPFGSGMEERLRDELAGREGEPPWPGKPTILLATLISLKASGCLASRDRCHGLDGAVGDLISRMTPEGEFRPMGEDDGSCPGGGEERTAAALAAIAAYGKVLVQRAALVRPTTEP